MTRFFAAALLTTATVASAQTTPCPAAFTGAAVPIVVVSSPAPIVTSIQTPVVQPAVPGSGQPLPLNVTPVVLSGTSPSVPILPSTITPSAVIPSIQSVQVVSSGTLGTVLSQLPTGAKATLIYADRSIASATGLGNAMNFVVAQANSASPLTAPAGASGPAVTVITGLSPVGIQGSCFLYQIAGKGFGSGYPPTVTLVGFSAICSLSLSENMLYYQQDYGFIDGTPCSVGPYSYWFENEIPATVVDATDSMITVAVPRSLAGVPSLGIVVTNRTNSQTGDYCSIQSGNDPCAGSPYVTEPDGDIYVMSIPYTS